FRRRQDCTRPAGHPGFGGDLGLREDYPMKPSTRDGFTIIEVLIAIMMLSVGVLALASSSGSIARMMYFGQRKTDASALVQSVLDSMRYRANAATPMCNGLASGT